ncbi:MAG TPA: DUF899 domain-containing protein [Opitutaceae bacterium]|nr:DUF899 domain-containing protein [Opitutaceae bacterium]
MKTAALRPPKVVPRDRWLIARRELLQEEKKFTRQRERLTARRQRLPWVRLEKDYAFAGPGGRASLGELFGDKHQLVVYHFMLGPGWAEGCKHCSFVVDHVDGMLPHLAAKDVAFCAISHAPWPEIRSFRKRMGWKFPWFSAHGSDFNADFGVSFDPAEITRRKVFYNFTLTEAECEELPGLSVFARGEDGAIYHTYSTYSRGLENLINTYNYLDLVPKGRDEDPETTMRWVRHHDDYAGVR